MSNEKWDNLTNDTNDLISKAIESGNYNSLKRDVTSTIEKAVKSAIDIGRRTIEQPPVSVNLDGKRVDIRQTSSRTVKVNTDGNTVEINQSYADRVRKPNTGKYKMPEVKFGGLPKGGLYISSARLWIGGFVKTFCGALFGSASFGAATSILNEGDLIGMIFISLLGVAFFYMFYSGVVTLSNRRKFKKYRAVLSISETGDYASIADLAGATRESEKKTRKRVKMMINKNWFKQGYLDHSENTLMTSNEAYKLYKKSEESYKGRQKAEETVKANAEKKENSSNLPKEVREVLETGTKYLCEMKELNDRIPGEEVSDKISKIEALTARILARVESHPESVDETKQLMKYYLPMIIKLLHAYADMDEQPKPGQNIEKSKREIEGVLDELNLAFERLLDDLYKDTAWDVAADISVLNAMLKREGLKESDFSSNPFSNSKKEEKTEENSGEIKLHL